MTAGVHEVWARVAWAAVDLSRELGVSPDSLVVDLGIDAAELRRRKRVTWSDYCAIVERVTAAAGGMDEVAELLADSYHRVFPELRSLAGAVISPRAFAWFVFDVFAPIAWPPVASACEDLPGDRMRVSTILRPGARPCEAFFRGSVGTMRGITCHLDLPMAEIERSEVAPDRMMCEIRLPESRTLLRRARATLGRLVLGVDRDGTEIATTFGAPEGDPTARRLERAAAAWQLTPRQRDVLERIVAGHANKEIASELGCAEGTIELHVTRLFRKAEVTSRAQLFARFWSAD
jgi:DNA-binding CsgD family transcriptional regulator